MILTFNDSDEVKLDSQPQGLAIGSNGLLLVACIKHVSFCYLVYLLKLLKIIIIPLKFQLVLIRNRKKLGALTVSYETTCISYNETTNQVAVGGKVSKDMNVTRLMVLFKRTVFFPQG